MQQSLKQTMHHAELFEKFDVSKRGLLLISQIEQALIEIGVIFDAKTVQDILCHICDIDKDEIDIQQFERLLYICENTEPTDIPGMMFYAADEQKKGSIEEAELGQIFAKLNIKATEADVQELARMAGDGETISYQMFCYLIDEIMHQ